MLMIELKDQILSLLASSQYQSAYDLLNPYLETGNINPEILNLAGVCAYKLKNTSQSEILWKQVIKLNPLAFQTWLNLGLLYTETGQNDKAENCFRQTLKIDPGNVNALVNLGNLLMVHQSHVDAEHIFRHAITLTPDNALIYSRLGKALEIQNRLNEAEHCYRHALMLDNDSSLYRFLLASFLSTLGQSYNLEEAKGLFLELLKTEPTHFEAWNNLGVLLFETGFISAAQTAFSAAVTYNPKEISAQVNLAHVLLYLNNLATAKNHFEIALRLNPDLKEAHQGLSCIFWREGKERKASFHRNKGYKNNALSTLVYRGASKPIDLLILASARDGNVPWGSFVDNLIFKTTIIAVEFFNNDTDLPVHDLIFNSIGDADLCHQGLKVANQLIKKSVSPVINHPDAVIQTGRLINAKRLDLFSGITLPRMTLLSKTLFSSDQALEKVWQEKIIFPFLLRSTGFHGGKYFYYIDNPKTFHSIYQKLPGKKLLAIEFLDSRSSDSLFRKFRVMSINGFFYPIHMAISRQWKVHYFSSDTDKNIIYHKEEENYLKDFHNFLGPQIIATLEKANQILNLDYCGFDFGIGKNGNILLYEANPTMVLNHPVIEKTSSCRSMAINSALAAVKKMLIERSSIRFQ
ncbi:MAG: tetratricopeptide repeat protein [Pseudomonadota bacterium]|nr:tetratricopeptide repeat protein [Pseudomonadota bacterium]